MSLVFAGIVPHPPILIPNVGKDNLHKLDKTVKALQYMEQELYAAKPDTIITISPHGVVLLDTFLINLSDVYRSTFDQFGDFSTQQEFRPNLQLIEDLRESAGNKVPITITSEYKLDHGAAVPLYYLTQHLSNISLVPISYSLLDFQSHIELGEIIKDRISQASYRVAIIASGDLSHRLTKDAPAGYSVRGHEFDNKLIESLRNRDIAGIINLPKDLIEEAGECGLRSFLILLGAIQKINYQTEILSYEGPFGVGYLVANFKFK